MQRKFIPGSEWLYFKLYTGTKTADLLLMRQIDDFVNNLMKSGAIDKFFFIRYSDPDFHIRLRLHLADQIHYGRVFSDFYSHFSECVDNGSVCKVMCGTYVREIERYGIDTMSLSEDVFHIDSEAVLSLISCDESLMPRWHQAFLLVDDMIRVFITEQKDRCKFLLQFANSYRREFGFESSTYTKQLNDKYRSLRLQIEKLMLRDGDLSAIYSKLENRKNRLSPLAVMISEKLSDNNPLSLDNLLGSYIHMSINRLFRSKNRLNEMIVYDCLNRYYESVAAREKYSFRNKS
jgi:thiopeptide-type bacteriocin biosynthesis protein